MRKVLNVGGGSKDIPIPAHYEGWEHVLLDIDEALHPDIVKDARKLAELPGNLFDAVYASHILEHFYDHELPAVLLGMRHIVKRSGWVEIRVPDVGQAMKAMADGRDLDFILYHSPTGPISIADVLWGSRRYQMYQGGDFMTHKNGFTERTLEIALNLSQFHPVAIKSRRWELRALAFLEEPTAETRALLGVEHGN